MIHGDHLHIWQHRLTQASHPPMEINDFVTYDLPLRRGDWRVSANRYYSLMFKHDGNVVLYKKYYENNDHLIWESGTADTSANLLTFKKNGKLVLYGDDKEVFWSTHSGLGKKVVDKKALKLQVTSYGSLVAMHHQDVFWCSNTSDKLKTKFFYGPSLHECSTLNMGQCLTSKNMARRLLVQEDGNVVVYDSRDNARWASGTNGEGEAPYKLRMQDDANLVLYDANDTPTWASDTSGQGEGKRKLKLLNNGNLVIIDENLQEIWTKEIPLEDWEKEEEMNIQDRLCGQNGSYHSMKPGSFLKSYAGDYTLVFTWDCNIVVLNPEQERIWQTKIEGMFNNCHLSVQNDGNLVIYTNDGEPLWATDTYQEGMCDARVRLIMQEDGNLVLYDGEQNPLWASYDN